MELFIQLTLTGLTNGAILALAALGFVLIYKASDVINFAQGEFLLIGGYVVYGMVAQFGLAWPLGMLITIAIAIGLGAVVERLVLRPLIGEPIISVIMVTIGLSSLLKAIVSTIWGNQPKAFPPFIPSTPVNIMGATIGADRLWAIVIAIVMLGLFTFFFRRSKEGIAMRAVADDQQAALSMGISVKKIFAWAWSIAAISASIGGALVANIVGVSQELSHFGLRVFPVVILGGLDSIPGAIVGGIIIGLLETYTGGYVGHGLNQVAPFAILILILMVRPYGLFGQEIIERV
ncbi:MAG: branched-chain amino acid ABC transporter permease [Anaerolineae bacterium]|jgi:branched-chain amino acid transport system permease protein|nr:branched-chain amino acid ABC transporter permease [Anaerolineae bacterium]MBT7069555.1 branched-chain amino acid ABC transporter permease [Anaerolineae bacterium]MBT7325861.1 branched-chain amino acid ABC transporter permease [Anaerolineae bacterium]